MKNAIMKWLLKLDEEGNVFIKKEKRNLLINLCIRKCWDDLDSIEE